MKTIPFDINKAKAGAKVVTRAGDPVRIVCYDSDVQDYPIITSTGSCHTSQGKYFTNNERHADSRDLFLVAEPMLRPWGPHEVPVGAELREKRTGKRWLILTASECGVGTANCDCDDKTAIASFQSLLDCNEWKWPQEPDTAWKPCGIEVMDA